MRGGRRRRGREETKERPESVTSAFWQAEFELRERMSELEQQMRALAVNPPNSHSDIFNPYKLFQKEERGTITLRLPHNAWTAAFISPLIDKNPRVRTVLVGQQYLSLAATVAAQIVFIVFLVGVVHDGERGCSQGSKLLRVVATCVLFAQVSSTDLLETMTTYRWLRHVPKWDPTAHEPIADKHQTFLAMRRITSLKRVDNVYALATGITDTYRNAMRIGLFMKALIALVTLVFSAGYINFADSNETVFVNTLATLFILDIDRFAYDYMSAQVLKDAFEALQPLGLLGEHDTSDAESYSLYAYEDDVFFQYLGGAILIPLMGLVSLTLFACWCWDRTSAAVMVIAVCCPVFFVAALAFSASHNRVKRIDASEGLGLSRLASVLFSSSSSSATRQASGPPRDSTPPAIDVETPHPPSPPGLPQAPIS